MLDAYEKVLFFIERHALTAALIVMLLCAAGLMVLCGHIVLSDMANVRGTEPYFVFGIEKLLSGKPLYSEPGKFPFDMCWYSRLYYDVACLTACALGALPGDVQAITRAGRLVSVLATAATLLMTFLLLVKGLKIRRRIAVVACGLVLGWLTPWGIVVRPDALASLFALGSLYCATMSLRGDPRRWGAVALFVGANVCAGIAYLTKQPAGQVFAILALFSLFTADWRRLTITVAGGLAAFAANMAVGCGGQGLGGGIRASLSHLFNGLDRWNTFHKSLVPLFLHMNACIIVAGCLLLFLTWARPGKARYQQFLAFGTAFLFLFAATTSLGLGSAYHYFKDFMVFAAVALSCFFFGDCDREDAYSPVRRSREVLLAGFVICFLPTYTLFLSETYKDSPDRIGNRQPIANNVASLLRSSPGTYFFTTDSTLANFFPSRVVVPDLYEAALARTRQGVGFSSLEDLVKSGRVRYCILGREQTPDRQLGFLGVSAEGFQHVGIVEAYSIWEFDDRKE